MKKLVMLVAVAVCAIGISVSAAGATSPKTAASPKTVTVAMHDPGCHWFLVAGKYTKTLSVAGPVSLLNVDEATIKVAGPAGLKLERVGHRLSLAHGTYHITMVGQAPDDNHLKLVVR